MLLLFSTDIRGTLLVFALQGIVAFVLYGYQRYFIVFPLPAGGVLFPNEGKEDGKVRPEGLCPYGITPPAPTDMEGRGGRDDHAV